MKIPGQFSVTINTSRAMERPKDSADGLLVGDASIAAIPVRKMTNLHGPRPSP